jgi:hypothetical protein
METIKTYERYPVWIVLLSNLTSITIYVLGLIITLHTVWIVSVLYVVLILSLEFKLLKTHCINCYYWGKQCGFGKGKVSALFFKQGNAADFCIRELSWKDMIPDLAVSLIPGMIGIIILVLKFDILILISTVLLIALSTIGNGFIRGKLTCKFCKQRESGCPADKLFN